MAFQFLCPQGHLLQGDESQAGQQCMCPYCSSLFIVPTPMTAAPAAPEPEPTPPPGLFGGAPAGYGPAPAAQEGYSAPVFDEPAAPGPPPDFAGVLPYPDFRVGEPAVAAEGLDVTARGSAFLHVLCPSGHELETPREMLGQDALCPYCQVQFRLRFEDSVEYRREKAAEEERRMAKASRAWMQWSIAAAAVVLVGLIIMIAVAASH